MVISKIWYKDLGEMLRSSENVSIDWLNHQLVFIIKFIVVLLNCCSTHRSSGLRNFSGVVVICFKPGKNVFFAVTSFQGFTINNSGRIFF